MDDQKLITELRKKNRVAFDYLFTFYFSSLCVFADKYTGDRRVSEDIVEDFFVAFWENMDRIEIRSSLRAYFFTSVHNRCLDWLRRHRTENKYREKFLSKRNEAEVLTEEMIAESELRYALEKGLEQLAPRCREIFVMSRKKGLSNHEIAGQLGLSVRTVELQISTALGVLRKELFLFFKP